MLDQQLSRPLSHTDANGCRTDARMTLGYSLLHYSVCLQYHSLSRDGMEEEMAGGRPVMCRAHRGLGTHRRIESGARLTAGSTTMERYQRGRRH
jgi:hypothetical protein